jgi:hypothetical protein
VIIEPPASIMPNPVRLTAYDTLRARAFALRCIGGYADGSKSTAQSLNGIESDLAEQTSAREAEMAFCKFFGLDPMLELDWGKRPERGKDVMFAGVRWDIKHAGGDKALLLWPVTKNKDFEHKEFDALALVLGDAPLMIVWGWISKTDFREERQTAQFGSRLIPGTWHLHKARLTRFEEQMVVPDTKRDRQWFLDRLEAPE